ncbi:Hypothetical protein P9301_05081 [Prochlorococcus marinus str. MIT 9301]|uniref:Uncharacterized protein n=1 Tax=Prochlorococcus marinus (strain MIT 9301) TaxID=167546 RepID=A3PBK6_PROM0|nr:Hypothetical protein P9301_05081 [Prochlorococcus marinus str. MIT 9301]
MSKRKPVKESTISSVAVPPGPVGVTFLKDVDIKFYSFNQSYLNRLISALVRHLIKIFF